MCLIVLAYGIDPRFPFIVASNRDEYYDRPTSPAHVWKIPRTRTTRSRRSFDVDEDGNRNQNQNQNQNKCSDDDEIEIIAGKDLQAGGTWMGVTKSVERRRNNNTNNKDNDSSSDSVHSSSAAPAAPCFRFAAVTNYRERDETRIVRCTETESDITTPKKGSHTTANAGDTAAMNAVANANADATKVSSSEQMTKKQKLSRGMLVKDFLTSSCTIGEYVERLARTGHVDYDGFSLLFGEMVLDDSNDTHEDKKEDASTCFSSSSCFYYYSNRIDRCCPGTTLEKLQPGRIYGLSNRFINDPWPKVCLVQQRITKEIIQNILQRPCEEKKDQTDSSTATAADNVKSVVTTVEECMFGILHDETKPPLTELPNEQTGCSIELEELLSSIFIQSDIYGTRASTVVTIVREEQQLQPAPPPTPTTSTATPDFEEITSEATAESSSRVDDRGMSSSSSSPYRCYYTERSYGTNGTYIGTVSHNFEIDCASSAMEAAATDRK